MEKICLRCIVSGRVQGVWYRANTKNMAQQLGVKGWVRNLADGRVEVFACGEKEKVDSLVAWLWQGPSLAKVSDVSCELVPWEIHQDFESR